MTDVQPTVIVQNQRSTTKDQDCARLNNENAFSNDSTLTIKQQDKIENLPHSLTPPPSPSNIEFNRLSKKQRNKYSIRTTAAAANAILTSRKTTKIHRPPARLKNYDDHSDSETTNTEIQSKETGKYQQKSYS